ncbi:MAG: oxidoreductase [Bacteroidota bacterium]
MKWKLANIPNQEGRTAIVTGANSGLGLECAKALAQSGATVILACRNPQKAAQAQSHIRATQPDADLHFLRLDLSDLASVRQFAADFAARFDQLHILMNNAGIVAPPRRDTADGFEMQLGVNHLGHFALTGLLLPQLLSTPESRTVFVSSLAHRIGRIDFDDLNWEQKYRKWRAYGRSKLANLLTALELDRRLKAAGSSALAMAAHPGWAATKIMLHGNSRELPTWRARLMNVVNKLAQSAEKGALPQLYAATAPDLEGGCMYGPDGWWGMRGFPQKDRLNPKKADMDVAKTLFDTSEKLTGVHYRF